MTRYVKVETEERFSPGCVKKVYAGDRRIAVFNDQGTLFAVDDTCTHVGGSLSNGHCDNGVVTCPWHSAQFCLADGRSLGPKEFYRRLEVYQLRVKSGVIEVKIE